MRRSALYISTQQREKNAEVIELVTKIVEQVYNSDGSLKAGSDASKLLDTVDLQVPLYRIAVLTGVVDLVAVKERMKRKVTQDS